MSDIRPVLECSTIADLLADPKRWTTCALARNSLGDPVLEDDPSATCWCLAAAGRRIYGLRQGWRHRLEDAILKLYPESHDDYNSVVFFNNAHTHDEIMAVLREAAI